MGGAIAEEATAGGEGCYRWEGLQVGGAITCGDYHRWEGLVQVGGAIGCVRSTGPRVPVAKRP